MLDFDFLATPPRGGAEIVPGEGYVRFESRSDRREHALTLRAIHCPSATGLVALVQRVVLHRRITCTRCRDIHPCSRAAWADDVLTEDG
ncbi:hypothetical protein E1091_02380, partial [Micromonospora fluostatini]